MKKKLLTLLPLFILVLSAFTFAPQSSPPGTCWQDNCDGSLPLSESCGTPARTQSDVSVYDPQYGGFMGTLRMWQTGASGAGCMDIWATFDSNGAYLTQDSMDIAITRYENTGGNDGSLTSTECGPLWSQPNCKTGNNDVAVLGYEGHNEDCFLASIDVETDNTLFETSYTDTKICKA